MTTLASLHCPKCGVRGGLRPDTDQARAWVNLQNEETGADDWHSGPDVQCVFCACGHSFYQDGLDGSDPAPLRLTFAVGQIGPSGDGDGGSYFLTSLVRRDPAGTLTAQSLRDWAEAQLLSKLEAQGQTPGRELAFVTFMGSEEETAEA